MECAKFQGEDLISHKQAIAHIASRDKLPTITCARWNPGGYTLFSLPPGALWGQLREHAKPERL